VKLRRGDGTDGTEVPLGDFIRRLESRGVSVRPFADGGYVLAREKVIEAYFFENPVSEAEVRRVAELFGLDRKQLYFDVVERDLN
jgi:hypothetical protein